MSLVTLWPFNLETKTLCLRKEAKMTFFSPPVCDFLLHFVCLVAGLYRKPVHRSYSTISCRCTVRLIGMSINYKPLFLYSLLAYRLGKHWESNRVIIVIVNNYSLKSKWMVAEYLPSRKAARQILCHYSPWLKRTIVLVYIHEKISTTLDFNICRRKPFQVYFIDIPKREFTSAILFCLDHEIQGVDKRLSKRRFSATDGNRKATFRIPGQWSLPDFQTNRLC